MTHVWCVVDTSRHPYKQKRALLTNLLFLSHTEYFRAASDQERRDTAARIKHKQERIQKEKQEYHAVKELERKTIREKYQLQDKEPAAAKTDSTGGRKNAKCSIL